jgi:hypothetical protein
LGSLGRRYASRMQVICRHRVGAQLFHFILLRFRIGVEASETILLRRHILRSDQRRSGCFISGHTNQTRPPRCACLLERRLYVLRLNHHLEMCWDPPDRSFLVRW